MEIAPAAAVEIDRLVITLSRRVGAEHGNRLREMAGTLRLASLDMLPHFEDWLLTGTLTPELAVTRLVYRPAEDVLARLDELTARRLVLSGDRGYTATERLRPLLAEMLAARAKEARATWDGHETDVATVTELGRRVADAATGDHLVAVSHRSLPDPDDPFLRLEHRLFTLRYARQHDHAAAWRERGMTPRQMVVLTAIWHGEAPAAEPALGELVAAGLVTADHTALTPSGRTLREAIEADTNRRAQESFDALDPGDADEFLSALRRLPSAS